MRHIIVLMLLAGCLFAQSKIMPRDLSRETKVLMADTAKAIAHDTSAAIQAQLRLDMRDSTEFEVVSDNAQLKPAYKDVVIPKGDLRFRGNFGLYQDKKLIPGDKWGYKNLYLAKKSMLRLNPTGGGYRTINIGNSIMAGASYYIYRIMSERTGRNGLGFDPIAAPRYGTHVTITKTSGWVTYNENSLTQETWGISGNSYRGGIGDTLLYSPDSEYEYSDVRVWYLQKSGGGSFDVIIGTDTTTINTDGTSSIQAVRYSLLDPNTSHDITINNIITDSVTIYGIETFIDQNQSGYTPYWCTEGGTQASQWAPLMSFFRTFIDSIQCDNINILLGANDAGTSSRTGPQYAGDITRIIDTLIAIKPNTNITLFTQYPRDTGNGTGVEDTDFLALVQEYRDSLYSIASRKGCSIWDLQKYWPDFDDAFEEGLYSDIIHPSDLGYMFVAYGYADMMCLNGENYITKTGSQYLGGRYGFDYGSVSAPTISSSAKNSTGASVFTTTGIFFPSSGRTIGFSREGVEAARIGGSDIDATNCIGAYPTTGKQIGLTVFRYNNPSAWATKYGITTSNQTEINAAGDLILQQLGVEKGRFNSTGLRLGANTGATLVKVDLYPSTADSLRFIITNPTSATKDTSDWVGLK